MAGPIAVRIAHLYGQANRNGIPTKKESRLSSLALAIVAQAAGLLLVSAISASVLQRRARSTRDWAIDFRPAFLVALKAGLAAVVAANLAILAVAAAGDTDSKLLKNTGMLIGLLAWWFVHSKALAGLSGAGAPMTAKQARAMSAGVFAYVAGALFAVSAALTLALAAF